MFFNSVQFFFFFPSNKPVVRFKCDSHPPSRSCSTLQLALIFCFSRRIVPIRALLSNTTTVQVSLGPFNVSLVLSPQRRLFFPCRLSFRCFGVYGLLLPLANDVRIPHRTVRTLSQSLHVLFLREKMPPYPTRIVSDSNLSFFFPSAFYVRHHVHSFSFLHRPRPPKIVHTQTVTFHIRKW